MWGKTQSGHLCMQARARRHCLCNKLTGCRLQSGPDCGSGLCCRCTTCWTCFGMPPLAQPRKQLRSMQQTSRASLRYGPPRCGLRRGTCVPAQWRLMHGAVLAVRFACAWLSDCGRHAFGGESRRTSQLVHCGGDSLCMCCFSIQCLGARMQSGKLLQSHLTHLVSFNHVHAMQKASGACLEAACWC